MGIFLALLASLCLLQAVVAPPVSAAPADSAAAGGIDAAASSKSAVQSAIKCNNRGVDLFNAGKYRDAIKQYNEAIRLNPRYTEAYSNRGAAFDALNNPERAVLDYSAAIQLSPRLTAAYSNRAAAYADLGNFKNSINDWNVVIRRSPKDANAYNGRGNCHKALGDLQAALADFERAVALNPRFTKAIKNREAVRKSLQAGVSSLPGKNSEAVVAAAGGANVALPVSAPFSPSPPGTAGGGKAQPAAVNSRQADRQNATVRGQAAINADDRAAQAAAQAGATARPSAAVSPAESKAPASGQSPANAALPASSDGSVRRGQSVDGKPVAAAAAASVAPPAVGTEKNGAGSAAAISTNDKPRTGNWQAPAGGAGVDREQPKQAGAVGAQAAAKPDQRSANAAAFAASGNLARGPANPLLIFVSAFDHIAGNLLLACGQHQAAIDAFTAAVRSNPGDAFALYRRANAFAAAGQTEAALADYTAALQLAPRLHQAEAGRQRLTSNALDVHPIVKPGGL